MRLLIFTQAVDSADSNLGFFTRWIEEFAKKCERVTVVCLREGTHALPPNVRVLSLGKEKGTSRIVRVYRFYKYIISCRSVYDAVWVHMNPEYIVLGGFLWRLWHKPIALWYAHKSVTPQLRIAVAYADFIFGVARDSFKIPTSKFHPVGHGIDTELFTPRMRESSAELRLATVGRIAESKHLLEMLEMLDVLHEKGRAFLFTVIGVALTPTESLYEARFRAALATRPYAHKVQFLGAVAHADLPNVVSTQDMCLNFAETGNMDKAGLEALALGVPVFATNEAFRELLAPAGLYVASLLPEDRAEALEAFMNNREKAGLVAKLRSEVLEKHSLANLIPKILTILRS